MSTEYRQDPEFGSQFHGMWTSYTDEEREHLLDRLQEANIRTVRLDVSWAMLQPNDGTSYDSWGVDFVDRVIGMINAHSMTPLITLWLTPGWANGGQSDRTLPNDPADYARAAQWAAQRYAGKVIGWEVWNEPNLEDFMVGADPAAYVRLLQAAYPALKAGDPTTTVVFGGVSYNDDDWIRAAYDAGAQGYFDVMATHPYMGTADSPPSTPDDGTKWTLTHAAAVRQLMEERGDQDKSLWFTECGWSSHDNEPGTPSWAMGVTEELQAHYLSEMMEVTRTTMPWVAKVYWYAERDSEAEGGTHNQNYGLVRADHSVKPVLTAASAVTVPPVAV